MRILPIIVCAFAIAACGDDRESEAPPPPDAGQLEVTVYPEGLDGEDRARTVQCDSEPKACAVPLGPTPPNVACTELYGGPAVAIVRGVIDGKRVSTEFSRENGCEIHRWDEAEPLIGPPPEFNP